METVVKKLHIAAKEGAAAKRDAGAAAYDTLTEFLRLELPGWAGDAGGDAGAGAASESAMYARVVKEPAAVDDGAQMTVAVPVGKERFQAAVQDPFLKALRDLFNGAHDVRILHVVDKPSDFRGGGALHLCVCGRPRCLGGRACRRPSLHEGSE